MIGLVAGFMLMGSAISANKIVMAVLPSTLFTGIRMLSAGLILLAMVLPKNDRFSWDYLKKDLIALFMVGFCTTYVTSLLKAWALKNLLSSKAAFIASLDPFVAALYAYLLWGEKLSLRKWAGLCIGFTGVILLLRVDIGFEQFHHTILDISLPECAALAAVAIGRYGWIIAAQFLKKGRYTSMELNGISMTTSGVAALITATFVDPIQSSLMAINLKTVCAMTYSIIVGNVISYNIYGYCLKKYSVTMVSLFGFIIPLTVATIGFFFLHEELTIRFVVSALIVFIGLSIFYSDELKKNIC
ncbi:DMT family transporter [Candidatus Babeliales bacterium]|nr:DMT family transporter [Candidatus Babeliales bacterium]